MRPRRTPCFCSNASPCAARSAVTAVMSTSLKVVSIAAVSCASFSRSPARRRRRLMGTRSSRLCAAADGADSGCTAAGTGAAAGVTRVGTGAAGGAASASASGDDSGSGPGVGVAADAARATTAASTSLFSRRPPLPVPSISVGSRPCSSSRRRTAGDGGGETLSSIRETCGSGSGATAAASPVSRRPSSAPTSTSVPSTAAISARVPAASALTSTAILSVSSSTSVSSTQPHRRAPYSSA